MNSCDEIKAKIVMALENTKTQGLLWEAVVATTKWLFLGQEKNRLFGKACEEENKETMRYVFSK